MGRVAYLPLKHQQVALPPQAGTASASGRERSKVLLWIIPQICWGQLLNVGGFLRASESGRELFGASGWWPVVLQQKA